MPGLVPIDLTQPKLGAVLGQPRRGVDRPDVDRVARHVCRRAGSRHPAGSFPFRPVLQDRLMEQVLLVLRRTPAAVDDEPDALVCGSRCSPAQGMEERRMEVADTGNLVVEDRSALGDGTVSLAKRTTGHAAEDVDG